jgi:hypothetical protein
VSFNDDTGVTTQSRITGVFVPAPGLYYLAIARFDRDATGLAAEIWADTHVNTERAPDGSGAANAIDGWNGIAATSITGSYSIFLTGASFPDLSTSCADLAVSGSGAPGTDLTFALTGADPNTLAMAVLGFTEGATVIRIGPIGTLELGLLAPFVLMPMGFTDANGDVTNRIHVPLGQPLSLDMFAQAFSSTLTVAHGPPTLTFCTSGVEPFHVGN